MSTLARMASAAELGEKVVAAVAISLELSWGFGVTEGRGGVRWTDGCEGPAVSAVAACEDLGVLAAFLMRGVPLSVCAVLGVPELRGVALSL